MFSISEKKEGDFDKIVLYDGESKAIVEIIPSCGGTLHLFSIPFQGNALNVIDHYSNQKDFKKNVTSKGFKSCKLSPFACRIENARYTFSNKEFVIKKFLLNGSALHGLLYDADFTVIEQKANENMAKLTMQYIYQGSDPGYPFNYDCIITYELEKQSTLTISTTIINRHSDKIPIQDGWHPYFTFEKPINDLQLEFQSMGMIEFNELLIPTGNLLPYSSFSTLKKIDDTILDNCYTLNFDITQPLCILRDTERKLQVEIRPEKSYPYLQIYTPPGRKSIAIENLSAPPDVFNNGLGIIILPPGASEKFKTTFKITALI